MATKYVVTGDQALRIGNRLAEIQRQVFLQKEDPHDPEDLIRYLQGAADGKFVGQETGNEIREIEVTDPPRIIVPNLRSTYPTLAEWLEAREELHKFFTGQSVILRDMFALTDEQLARTDLIPVFRPSGATNRLAVDWKKKLGVDVYEETDVMKYKNSVGPKTPELYLISRSLRPDADTLGDNANTPDQLIQVPNKLWLNLYGWADADTLHFAITGEHLDPKTWTWFPNDRLPDGGVASGYWGGAGGCLRWRYAGGCGSYGGARAAVPVSLKT